MNREQRIEALIDGLLMEFGRPPCNVAPHDPTKQPYGELVEMATDPGDGTVEPVDRDLRELLTKPVTRGFVRNAGRPELLAEDGSTVLRESTDYRVTAELELLGGGLLVVPLDPGDQFMTSGIIYTKLRLRPSAEGPTEAYIFAQ